MYVLNMLLVREIGKNSFHRKFRQSANRIKVGLGIETDKECFLYANDSVTRSRCSTHQ